MHLQLEYTCPHCLAANPGLGPQRCGSCGLNMLSDREQLIRESRIAPLARQLDEQLLYLRAGKPEQASLPYAFGLLEQLQAWRSQGEAFAFLDPLLEAAREGLAPYDPPRKAPDRTLMINIAILILLIMAPVSMAFIGADPMVIVLLCLPVLGWAYLGIWGLRKKGE